MTRRTLGLALAVLALTGARPAPRQDPLRCSKWAHAADAAAQRHWQQELHDFVGRARPDLEGAARAQLVYEMACLDRFEARFQYVLEHQPQRFLIKPGLTGLRDFDWTQVDETVLGERDARYARLVRHIDRLRSRNEARVDWPALRSFCEKAPPPHADWGRLVDARRSRDAEVERLLRECTERHRP